MTNFQLGDDGELPPKTATEITTKAKLKRKRGEPRPLRRWILLLAILATGLVGVWGLSLSSDNPHVDIIYPTNVPTQVITVTPGGYFDTLTPCEPPAEDTSGFILMSIRPRYFLPQLVRYDFDRQRACMVSDPRIANYTDGVILDRQRYAAIQHGQNYLGLSNGDASGHFEAYSIFYHGADTSITTWASTPKIAVYDWRGDELLLPIPTLTELYQLNWSGITQTLFLTGYDNIDYNTNIYQVTLKGELTTLTDDPRIDTLAHVSPDGTKIVFISDRTYVEGGAISQPDSYELYLMDVDGSNVQRLTENAVMDSLAVWSPDGKQLATVIDPAQRGSVEQIALIDLATNQRRLLPHHGYEALSPLIWATDGWIYFMSGIGYEYRRVIYRIHPSTHAIEPVLTLPYSFEIDDFDIWTPPSNETTP